MTEKKNKNADQNEDQLTQEETGKEETGKDPKKELESLQLDLDNKKKEVEKAEKAAEEELFKKYGYKVLSDLKYGGKILPVGSRDHLRNLKKPEINQLITDGMISK